MKPVFFSIHRKRKESTGIVDGDASVVLPHQYTELSTQRPNIELDAIHKWREELPCLEDLFQEQEPNCDIIHMHVALDMTTNYTPRTIDLEGQMIVAVPSQLYHGCKWEVSTTVIRPGHDGGRRTSTSTSQATVLEEDVLENQIELPFLEKEWSSILAHITDLQLSRACGPAGLARSWEKIREYLQGVRICQELMAKSFGNKTFVRRAVLLWTFGDGSNQQRGTTMWQYVAKMPATGQGEEVDSHARGYACGGDAASGSTGVKREAFLERRLVEMTRPSPHSITRMQDVPLDDNEPFVFNDNVNRQMEIYAHNTGMHPGFVRWPVAVASPSDTIVDDTIWHGIKDETYVPPTAVLCNNEMEARTEQSIGNTHSQGSVWDTCTTASSSSSCRVPDTYSYQGMVAPEHLAWIRDSASIYMGGPSLVKFTKHPIPYGQYIMEANPVWIGHGSMAAGFEAPERHGHLLQDAGRLNDAPDWDSS